MAAKSMSELDKELVFLILQLCDEEGLKDTAHMLERETGCYFDMKFFVDMVLGGKWDEIERYLSGFINVTDDRFSTKIYFEIRKQKFLEALDNNDRAKALDILMKDLKVFAQGNQELFREMTQLLTLDDIREHELLSTYRDAESARITLMYELKKIIQANPAFCGKLEFPSIRNHRLRGLINQSLNWQHAHCKYPQPNPVIKTLFMDHICQLENNPLSAQSTEKDKLHSEAESMTISPTVWNASRSIVSCPIASTEDGHLSNQTTSALANFKDSTIGSQKSPLGTEDEVTSTVSHPGKSYSSVASVSKDFPKNSMKSDMHKKLEPISSSDLPKTLTKVLNEGSSPMTMDFHPIEQTFLLVGTNIGDIRLWDIISGEKLLSRNFRVWNIGACSITFKTSMVKDSCVSVKRVAWSPDGSFFGVAYSKHIVQLYSYHGCNKVQQQLEIDAHDGSVNDLVFSTPDKQLLVITGGDDKKIKVWDVINGVHMYTFEGHEAPIYSLCPHSKESIHFLFSTSVDGQIKAWLYDNLGARIHYAAPGLGCSKMAYSADDRRLFSCGTNKNGESFLVEWDESEGTIRRNYLGLHKNSSSVVQFDASKNKFLAAADDHIIKIWDMDKVDLLATIDADGDLPETPHICFNKEGSLLALFSNQNKIKILANDYGVRLVRPSESCYADTTPDIATNPTSTVLNAGEADGYIPMSGKKENFKDVKSKFVEKVIQINSPSQCLSLPLPTDEKAKKISRLIYTNAGNAILALASNATHLLWKWPRNNINLTGKATTNIPPQLWLPRNCTRLMTNDLTGSNPEEAVPCFTLSKNDSYLMSASGGMISLFNMVTFKTMMTIMAPSPAASCLALHPQDNNVAAIGMDDSTISIYNIRLNKVNLKLMGHSKRVTGLAFSDVRSALVSSGADAQICIWNVDGWKRKKSVFLQIPDGELPVACSDTHVQFHMDQTHFLVVHESLLAIYEAKELECVKQWVSGDSVRISQATFSCDCQMVYTSFVDGTVSIFGASNLELNYHIVPSAYLPLSKSLNVYPVAIAAHPTIPTQFAVGLTDGKVIVVEPPPGDNGVSWH